MVDESLYIEDFQHILLNARGRQIKVVCPLCHDRRTNKADRSLSINTETLAYHCHYCDAKGYLKSKMDENVYVRQRLIMKPKREYIKPNHKPKTDSAFQEGFLKYFESRGISESTLKLAKVTQETEFFPQKNARVGCIAFNYYLLDELVNVKYRTRDKNFKLISGARLIPYNIDSISPDTYSDDEEKSCIITEGECFDKNAQILTTEGFKLFSELSSNDLVAQYDNGIITFVKPLERIRKFYNGNLIQFSNQRNSFYSLTTPNHNLACIKNGFEYKIKAADVKSAVNIIRSGVLDGEGIDLSDDEIRLFCAISADFTIRKEGDLYCRLKKQRKVERLCGILDRLGIKYSNNIDGYGYNSIFIRRGHGIFCQKDFPMEWIGRLSKHQIELILEEVILWDGNKVKGRTMTEYNSNRYNNIVFIQTLCHLSNRRSVICKRSNKYGEWYKCTIINKTKSTISIDKRKDIPYNDYVYCVTVPSGKIVVRQNDLITVSGNCDALTYLECGFKHVISIPNGANTNLEYLDDFIESHFDKLDYIYISVDNDKKGLECRAEFLRRFGNDKSRIIDYPKPCKDINEVLCNYGKEAVKKCVKEYFEIKPEGINELIDVEDKLDFLFEYGMQKGTTIGVPQVDEFLSFQTGMLCVVTGVPTHGKTYMLNYILSKLNIIHDWKVAFFSPEFYPIEVHIAQIVETLGGRKFEKNNYNHQEYVAMKEYVCSNFFWLDPNDTDIESVMNRCQYLIKKKGIKAFVIDPFNSLSDKNRKNEKQDEYISDFLQRLRWFARKYNIAVFLVMHPTKMIKQENGLYPVCDLYNCKGASEIFDKADIGLTVWRNEIDNYAELHVTKIKFRYLGEKGHTSFKFNINNGRYVAIGDASQLIKNGTAVSSMLVDWDNTNWIVDKINKNKVQNTLSLPSQEPKSEYPYVKPTSLDSSIYETSLDECPF